LNKWNRAYTQFGPRGYSAFFVDIIIFYHILCLLLLFVCNILSSPEHVDKKKIGWRYSSQLFLKINLLRLSKKQKKIFFKKHFAGEVVLNLYSPKSDEVFVYALVCHKETMILCILKLYVRIKLFIIVKCTYFWRGRIRLFIVLYSRSRPQFSIEWPHYIRIMHSRSTLLPIPAI